MQKAQKQDKANKEHLANVHVLVKLSMQCEYTLRPIKAGQGKTTSCK